MLYTISLGIVLLAARYILVSNFTRIVNETTLVTLDKRVSEQQINNINKQIAGAKQIQKTTVPWPEFLAAFAPLVPDGVVINSIQLTADGQQPSTINGQANTREALLDFQTALISAHFITDVYLPFQSLLSKTDADFDITITILFDKIGAL